MFACSFLACGAVALLRDWFWQRAALLTGAAMARICLEKYAEIFASFTLTYRSFVGEHSACKGRLRHSQRLQHTSKIPARLRHHCAAAHLNARLRRSPSRRSMCFRDQYNLRRGRHRHETRKLGTKNEDRETAYRDTTPPAPAPRRRRLQPRPRFRSVGEAPPRDEGAGAGAATVAGAGAGAWSGDGVCVFFFRRREDRAAARR